jgi:hypothetical protein
LTSLEERKVWIVEEAQAMCEKLDYPLPRIVFTEDKLLGITTRIRVVPSIAPQKPFTRKADPGELRISPRFLAESSEAQLRHTLAFALVFGDPAARKRVSNQFNLDVAISSIPIGILGLGAWLWTESRLWTGCVTAVVFAAILPRLMKQQAVLMSEPWLKAIELSGETEIALVNLRAEPKPDPKWVPGFLSRLARKHFDDRRNYIEKEAVRRGLLLSREDR